VYRVESAGAVLPGAPSVGEFPALESVPGGERGDVDSGFGEGGVDVAAQFLALAGFVSEVAGLDVLAVDGVEVEDQAAYGVQDDVVGNACLRRRAAGRRGRPGRRPASGRCRR
jgi:hypothetical protein